MLTTSVRRWVTSRRPGTGELKTDAVASLPVAVSAVPDGMAAAALIGVSPIHGLYATAFGGIAGGLSVATSRMVIATTTASALAAASVLSTVDVDERPQALFLLTVLAGLFMIAAGLARLGRYTRFVSHSVMIGFLTGVSVSLILGQVPDFAGATTDAGSSVGKFLDIVLHPSSIHWPTLAIGASTIVLLILLGRTPLGPFASIVAIAIPTAVVALLGLDQVAQVSDAGDLPRGLPLPTVPQLDLLTPDLLFAAGAVAIIVLIQGFGVAQSVPDPGPPPDGNGDFIGQGAANVVAGLFRGMPVGGSVGQTALMRASGAVSRWGCVLLGVWMTAILVALSPLIGYVANAALAAVLIYAGFTSINPPAIMSIWQTSPISRVAMVSTFIATLFLPVPTAVAVGVAISLLLQLNQEAMDLRVIELRLTDLGIVERPPPATLDSESVTVLAVHGSLYFAGARTLQAHLPDPGRATRPVVVLRLRGRTQLGATALVAIGDYGKQLRANGGRLYLSGVSPTLMHQLATIDAGVDGPVTAFPATDMLQASTRYAYEEATTWLVGGTGTDHTA